MSVCIDGIYVPGVNESAIGKVCPDVNTQYLIDQALEANVSAAYIAALSNDSIHLNLEDGTVDCSL